jgi:hypothetical protein
MVLDTGCYELILFAIHLSIHSCITCQAEPGRSPCSILPVSWAESKPVAHSSCFTLVWQNERFELGLRQALTDREVQLLNLTACKLVICIEVEALLNPPCQAEQRRSLYSILPVS